MCNNIIRLFLWCLEDLQDGLPAYQHLSQATQLELPQHKIGPGALSDHYKTNPYGMSCSREIMVETSTGFVEVLQPTNPVPG